MKQRIKEKVLKRLIKEQVIFQTDIDNAQAGSDWEIILRETLAEVRKIIDEDIKYQKSKLEGNFEKDKPFKWRIDGFNYIKRQIEIK